MRRFVVTLLSVLLTCTAVAQEKKADTKKSEKAKAKAAQKSDKNVFQKAESSIGDWAHRNKIWTRSESRSK